MTTGTKAKRQQLQQGQNFRGSTLSEGSSNVGLLRGAAFGIQQEFMQFKNSLLEGKANISDAKQKRKRYKNNSQWVYVQAKGPFLYYVRVFLAFSRPPTHPCKE